MAKRVKLIDVETLPNGYSLKFDGMTKKGGYMYFTPEKLLEGFMLHIGLNMTDQLNTETMQDFIVAACNWKDNKDCVKEIERLTHELKMMRGKRDALARRLMSERNHYISLMDSVNSIMADTKANPDKDLRKELTKLMKGMKKLPQLTLQSLCVNPDEAADDEPNDEDDDV